MELERYPTCSRRTAVGAPSCPKCGQVLSDEVWRATVARAGRTRLWWGLGTIVILALVILFADRGAARAMEPGIVVTQTEFGDRWPFPTKPEGVLRCERLLFGGGLFRPVVTITFGTEV